MTYSIDKTKGIVKQARQVNSPNCDARPDSDDISLLVIHSISLPPGQYGGPHVDQLFTNCLDPDVHPYFDEIKHLRVSSHLFINRQAQLTQYVPLTKRAWHAGESEFDGRQVCNDFSIGIELEGCDDENYCDAQYLTLAEVTKSIREVWNQITKDRIVGHSHIAPDRKTDPGEAFDWDYYFSLIQ